MEAQTYLDFIKPELLILIPILYALGLWLKASSFPDKFIPLLLAGVGMLLATLHVFATVSAGAAGVAAQLFTGITQGLLCAAASVFANQIYKQSKK